MMSLRLDKLDNQFQVSNGSLILCVQSVSLVVSMHSLVYIAGQPESLAPISFLSFNFLPASIAAAQVILISPKHASLSVFYCPSA